MDKIIYIGAGTHIDIIDDFPIVKEFVFVDNRPRCDNDIPYFTGKTYDKNFCRILIDNLDNRNFKLTNTILIDEYWKTLLTWKQKLSYLMNDISELINPTILIFTNTYTGQKVKYYISTSVLYNMSLELKQDIKSSDAFIFDASYTNKCVLEYFDEPKICISYLNNNYDTSKYDTNTLIHFLNNNTCSISYYFREFYLVLSNSQKNPQIKCCESFNELKNELDNKRKEKTFYNCCKIDVNLCNFV